MHPSARLHPSDLSDQEWEILASSIPPAKLGGTDTVVPTGDLLDTAISGSTHDLRKIAR